MDNTTPCGENVRRRRMIEKHGDKWILYSRKKDPKTGKRKRLGTFSSRVAAEKREQQIQYFKHKK